MSDSQTWMLIIGGGILFYIILWYLNERQKNKIKMLIYQNQHEDSKKILEDQRKIFEDMKTCMTYFRDLCMNMNYRKTKKTEKSKNKK